MERELEKDLKEIEYLIYVHKERENTHTQSVLERAHEIIETCAKAARTLSELEELLSRENTPEITRSPRHNKCGECSRRTWYMKGYKDALKEDGVSEAFLEDCKRVAQKYKKDNDGWIPVEERLPEKNEYFVDTSSNKEFPNGYYRRLEIAYMTDTVEYIHGYYDGYKWMDEYLDAIKNVVAWRIHEPYRPERSSDEKE